MIQVSVMHERFRCSLDKQKLYKKMLNLLLLITALVVLVVMHYWYMYLESTGHIL